MTAGPALLDREPAPVGWRRLLVEPARPDAIRRLRWAPWLVVATVCIGGFMGQLDASVVTLAFPTLRHDFNASLATVQWVGQAYLLSLIGLLLAVGRYADMVGRKLFYTYGFVLFIVGSLACGLAPSLTLLIVFRIVQGAGAAMFQANSVAILVGAVPPTERGRAIGVQGAAQALGLALGPALGGLLIGLGGWRTIFLINVPVGVVGIALAWFLIPRSTHLAERVRFDWLGLGLLLPAVCALLAALTSTGRSGWDSRAVLGSLVVAALLTAGFLVHERRSAQPMVDLGLFKRLAFRAGVSTGLLSYVVLFGTLTVAPFLLEVAGHRSPASAGALLLVLPLALGITAPVAGRVADRIGSRPFTVGGMLLAAGGLLAMTVAPDRPGLLVAALVATGVGVGMFTPSNNAAVMGATPPSRAGVASGMLNMSRGLGTSLGLAVAGTAYTLGAGAGIADPTGAVAGFRDAVWLLAVVAVAAAVISARGERPGHDHDLPAGAR